jgi:hypothetical protein
VILLASRTGWLETSRCRWPSVLVVGEGTGQSQRQLLAAYALTMSWLRDDSAKELRKSLLGIV